MRARETGGLSSGLVLFFLRARPVRAGALVALLSAALLIILLVVLQALRLSGAQQADQYVGKSEYLLPSTSSVPLGTDGGQLDKELLSAIEQSGASGASVSYMAFQLVPDDFPDLSLTIEENDWTDEPFPNRLILKDLRCPSSSDDVAVSSALLDKLPIGTTFTMFDGALDLTVVGIATDDFARATSFLLAPKGTWNGLSDLSPEVAARFGVNASRQLLWSGGNLDELLGSVNGLVGDSSVSDEEALVGLHQQLWSRADLEQRPTTELLELTLASLVASPLAGLLGALFAARFVNRIRSTMLTIGISRERTRAVGIGAVLVSVLGGAVIGVLLGLIVGVALRPLIDLLSNRAIGPVHDVLEMGLRVIGLTVVGAVAGLLLVKRVRESSRDVSKERRRLPKFLPTMRQALPAVALVFVFVGVGFAQAHGPTDEKILAGMSIGMAIVVLSPFVLDLAVRKDPGSFPAMLAIRRLRAENRASGWLVIGIAALLLISFGATTLFYSAAVTTNEQTESFVPPNQIQLEPQLGSESDQQALIDEVETYIGVSDPLTVFTAEGGSHLMDGVTKVLASSADLERLLGLSLTSAERTILEGGGTLRTKDDGHESIQFETYSGDTSTLPALSLTHIDPSFRNFDGFILEATAEGLEAGLSNRTLVYTDVTADQLARAETAATDIGFNSSWLNRYSAPDVFSEPFEATLAAVTISILAGLLMVFYAASAARSLRPNLAGLRSIGVGKGWLNITLAVQAATLVVVAIVAATLGACVGMLGALRVSGLDVEFHVPWQSIGITVFGLLVGSTLGVLFATRRLAHSERMTH